MTGSAAPAAWALVALALLTWPLPRSSQRAATAPGSAVRGTRDPGDAARRERVLTIGAALALAAAIVLTAGVRAGLPVALVVVPAVVTVIGRLGRRPPRPVPDRGLALALDLVAAVLRSGRTLADALAGAAPAARSDVRDVLLRVSRLLALGADPSRAWSTALRQPGAAGVASLVEPVVAVAVRSQDSGIRLADAFERLAVQVRADCSAQAMARANRAGVAAMAPLAACFLPSFVCLGIVPVVVGVASTALRGVL